MIKGSIFLGLRIHKQHSDEHRIPLKVNEEMLKREWWEQFMQVNYEDLMSF